ncbi:MAG: hypothetical protein ABI624_00455 [Casimicrobiaceae bacterium]
MSYGSAGRFGIGTPQANPTVEAEMGILLPRNCTLSVTRLTSVATDPLQRLHDYLSQLKQSLRSYDTLRPDAFGFACTGSSYLLGAAEERRLVGTASSAGGYPVETAARAIIWALERLRARRIALVAPYPQELVDAGVRYWTAAGIEIARTVRIATPGDDTRGIYCLADDVLAAPLAQLRHDDVDAILISGTGLPSLAAIHGFAGGPPVVSSNLCLAARLLDVAGDRAQLQHGAEFIRDWPQRLAEALAPRV